MKFVKRPEVLEEDHFELDEAGKAVTFHKEGSETLTHVMVPYFVEEYLPLDDEAVEFYNKLLPEHHRPVDLLELVVAASHIVGEHAFGKQA